MQLQEPRLFRQQAFINGQWRDADSGAQLQVVNPATGQTIGSVPDMGTAETRQAIAAASSALPAWRALTAKKRSDILQRWYALMLEHQQDLAQIMTIEQGKPLAEAKGEISYGASFIQWFAEEAKRAYGDIIPSPMANSRLLVIKQPVGVCAAITPWNFPSAMITRKAAAALAAGCTMVVKPAAQTPFSALALAELAARAGVPDGVLSVVTGQATVIGQELTSNPAVRKLSFTGSTAVGRKLLRDCANDIKKVSLELGGNAPFIVFPDADLDAAVAGAIQAKFRNAGQTCVCVNRFYVHQSIYQDFARRLAAAASKLRIGNGLDEGVEIGPLINMQAVDKVQQHIDDALKYGAKIISGGQAGTGNFFPPTVLTEVSNQSLPATDETFGPLAALIEFTDEQEVIAMANNTEYGLAAYFYSRDLARCLRVGEALEYGMVGINSGIISTEVAPFGGIKASGLGREGSKYGLDEYLELKYLHLGAIE